MPSSIGVFQAYYQSNMLSEYSPSTISWIGSLEVFAMFFFGPAIGKVYDNYGPRHLLAAGTFLEVFGLMMASLSTKYYQLLLSQGLCSSIGASLVFYPALSALPTWFFKKRAFAFGIVAAGSSLGGVIFPIMIQHLIPEVGFPWSMRIAGFLILALLLIANFTITSRMPPRPSPFDVREFLVPFKELPFDLICFGAFVFFLGMFPPINYIILEAEHYGMSPSLAAYMVPVLNGASLFGRVLPGYIADHIGRFNMMIIMDFFTAITILALWLPATGNAPIVGAHSYETQRSSWVIQNADFVLSDYFRGPLRLRQRCIRFTGSQSDRADIRCAKDRRPYRNSVLCHLDRGPYLESHRWTAHHKRPRQLYAAPDLCRHHDSWRLSIHITGPRQTRRHRPEGQGLSHRLEPEGGGKSSICTSARRTNLR